MKKIIVMVAIFSIIAACSKNTKSDDPEIAICFGQPAWLEAKKAEYSSCLCLTGFRQGVFKGQTVIEIYGFDPLCDGINIVYKMDGTPWFNTGDKSIYADYTANVTQQSIIWTCAKGGK